MTNDKDSAMTDTVVWSALEAFEKEFNSWRIIPDLSSQYNGRDGAKYKYSWVANDMLGVRWSDPVTEIPEKSSFKRVLLETKSVDSYITWHAIRAAVTAALQEQSKCQ